MLPATEWVLVDVLLLERRTDLTSCCDVGSMLIDVINCHTLQLGTQVADLFIMPRVVQACCIGLLAGRQ